LKREFTSVQQELAQYQAELEAYRKTVQPR